jgi:penicillin-binding protein 2
MMGRALRRGIVFVLLIGVCAPAFANAARRRSSRRSRVPHPVLVYPPRASAHDLAVAEACREALGTRRGSVMAMDPRNGRVMALVRPDVGLFKAYTPCSVIKAVIAVAGLSEGIITPETIYDCHGGCWIWPGHGPIDLRRALAVSCNSYFEWVGAQLGYAKIREYARLLGLGEPTGINLTGEVAGILPEDVPPSRVERLSSHGTGIAMTIVQAGVLMATLVNGGVVYRPQIANDEDFEPREIARLPADVILDGLDAGFLSAVDVGSARRAFDPDLFVAGKTGSCSGLGWFASYYPVQQPEIVIVVLLRPGSGPRASAVAGRVYERLFKSGFSTTAASGGHVAAP